MTHLLKWLPEGKFHQNTGTSMMKQRRTIVRHSAPSTFSGASHIHSFNDLKKYFERDYPYLRDWTVTVTDNNIIVEVRETGFLIPKYRIEIDESLDLTISVCRATVPNSSVLFPGNDFRLSSKFKDLHDVLCHLQICCGVPVEKESSASEAFLHVTPLVPTKQQSSPVNYCQTRRSIKSEILVEQGTDKCKPCSKLDEKKFEPKSVLPANAKAPLSACSSARLQATIREERVLLKESHNQRRECF